MSACIRRVPQPDDNDKEKGDRVLAVVVTISGSSSYDPLFTKYPQVMEGGVIRVYACDYSAVPVLCRYLTKDDAVREKLPSTSDTAVLGVIDELMAHIAEVDKEAVVFNFECCGSCSDSGFPNNNEVQQFARTIVDNGFMVMFSDFSLKGLIGSWDAKLLGPCPIVKVGELQSSFELKFSVDQLKSDECPSAQLTKVAELCKDGVAQVKAMGGTIMYSVNKAADLTNAPYKFEVLTVATKVDGRSVDGEAVTSAGQKGILGHAALHYPSGGVILTSCGHWVSLAHLDTSVENLREAVTKQMGEANYAEWECEYMAAQPEQQARMMQKKAAECVQKSAPCKYTMY